MLFTSLEFLIFFPIVFILYWSVFNKTVKARNFFIMLASFTFYGWWDGMFLLLMIGSTCVDFFAGIWMDKTENKIHRKIFFALSLATNLGLLGYFKYANFFIDSFADLLTNLGFQANYSSLQLILPVGISFYTFQALSYTINVYKRNLKATHDPLAYFAFISFFPQLCAGPIERAPHLLPQFYVKRVFSYEKAKEASRQILWGFFKKMVVADTCAKNVDYIFAHHTELQGSLLVLGVIYFAFQIYCDFSGYSDIALGLAKLMGFDLMVNFRVPYFSRDVAEFWRRWHISLNTWFRDYIYIPLGGSKKGRNRNILNVMIIFTVSGFWHGANWTFLIWGFLNGLFFIPLLILNRNKHNIDVAAENSWFPSVKEVFSILLTFVLICITWVFFRAKNVTEAFSYFSHIANISLFNSPKDIHVSITPLYLIFVLIGIEWIMRKKDFQLDVSSWPIWVRWPIYYAILFMIIQFGQQNVSFIYFQF